MNISLEGESSVGVLVRKVLDLLSQKNWRNELTTFVTK